MSKLTNSSLNVELINKNDQDISNSEYLDEENPQKEKKIIESLPQENTKQIPEKKKVVDLDSLEKNWELAQKHREVLRLNFEPDKDKKKKKGQDTSKEKKDEMCDCCGRYPIRKKIHLQTPNIKLSFLGPAYPLYFDFLVMMIFLLVVILLTSGLFNIISNAKSGNACVDSEMLRNDLINSGYSVSQADKQVANQCQANWISKYTLGNRRNEADSLLAQEYLNLLTIFIIIIFIQLLMRRARKEALRIDLRSISPSDYTIFITQIQKRPNLKIKDKNDKEVIFKNYRELILDYLENQMEVKDKNRKDNIDIKGQIAAISFCYNLDPLNKLESEKMEILRLKLEQSSSVFQNKKSKVKKIVEDKDMEEKNKQIEEFEQKCYNGNEGINEDQAFMVNHFVGQAFVSFKTEKVAKDFLKQVNKKYNSPYIFQGKRLYFEQAHDPTDIQWSNLYTKKTIRVIRIGAGFIINIFMVFLASLCIYKLADVQYSYTKSNSITPSAYEKTMIQFISIGISLLIIVINEILIRIVGKINSIKKFRIKTSEQISFTVFLSTVQFVNSTVIPLLLLVIVSSADSYYSILYSPTGLILNQNSLFMTNAIMPLIMVIIDPIYRYQQFLRNKEFKNKDQSLKSQREIQKLYEDPEFQLSTQYASAIKSMYMTFFYLSVMPISIFWTILALMVQYGCSKYLLVSKRVVLVSLGPEMAFSVISLLKVGLVIYSATCYYFLRISNSLDRPYVPSIIGIVIACLHLFIPLETINERLFKIKEDEIRQEEGLKATDNQLTYEQAMDKKFSTDYRQENPALKRKFVQNGGIVRKEIEYVDFDQRKIQKKQIKQENDLKKKEENEKLKKEKQEKNLKDKTKKKDDNNTDKNEIEKKKDIPLQQTEMVGTFINTKMDTQLKTSFGIESFDEVAVKIELILFNSRNFKENNKDLLRQYVDINEYLQKQFQKFDQKMKNSNLSEKDIKDLEKIEQLSLKVNDNIKNIRINLVKQVKEERKSCYLPIESPSIMIPQINQFCKDEQSQMKQEKIPTITKLLQYQSWISSYFRNHDKKLLDNQDYFDDELQLQNVEDLNEKLLKTRINEKSNFKVLNV